MSSQSSQAIAQPKPADQKASEAIMQAEAKERHRQTLQALIEAAAVTDPTIMQRVSVAAVWQYFRLPDDSFGWSGKKQDDGSRPPMPVEAKGLCILTTLALNLMPGVGHVLWLGNKAYVSADARRFLANRDRELKLIGKRTLRPFNDAEKDMFGVEAGDMHCVLEQRVRFKGEEVEWTGYGLIGKAELDFRDKWGNRKAGMQSKKDTAMHLITRAERDMLNRFYPVSGLPDAPDDPTAYEQDVALPVSPQASPMAIMAAEERADEARVRDEAATRLRDLAARVTKLGTNPSELVERNLDLIVSQGATTDELNDCGDVLEAWLAEHEQPDPPPADAAPSSSGTPAEAPPKRSRGRPRKDQSAPVAAAPAPSPAPDPIPAAEPVDVGAQFLESGLEEGEPTPAESFATDDPLPPALLADPLAALYEGTDAQKSHLRAAAADEGFKAAGDLWALAGAMKGRPMRDLYKVLEAFKTSRSSAAKAAVPKPAPAPAAAPAAPAPTATAAPALQAARDRLKSTLERVVLAGGAHMKITGFNTINLMSEGTIEEIEDACRALDGWIVGTQPPKPAAPAPVAAPAPAPTPPPAAPPPAKRSPAHDMIAKALTGDMPAAAAARLQDLAARELRDGDHLYLPKAIRQAKAGDFRELDELIGSRPPRR